MNDVYSAVKSKKMLNFILIEMKASNKTRYEFFMCPSCHFKRTEQYIDKRKAL